MMNDWKVRQEIFHRLNKEHDDDLKTKNIILSNNIIEDAIRYFSDDSMGWVYPAKSYMVAICYARWISENFGEDFIECLNDKDLLYGNDPYFLPYNENKSVYNKILESIDYLNFDETKGMVPHVRSYFDEEFMLNEYA